MRLDLDALPDDPALLQHLVRELVTDMERRDGEIEKLRLIVKELQRSQFGRRSEKLDPDQLALGLEDLDADIGRAEERHAQPPVEGTEAVGEKSEARRQLPEHLPRQDILHDVDRAACPCCGGILHAIGETVSEMLDWVPASLRVLRIRRPKYGCRSCGNIQQAPAPERAIAKGLATSNLLAQVLVAKYCDHTPLYRQSQIFARHGVAIDRSTLAGWVGGRRTSLHPLLYVASKGLASRPGSSRRTAAEARTYGVTRMRVLWSTCGLCAAEGAAGVWR